MKSEITKYYDELAKDYDADRFNNTYGQYIHNQEHKVIKKYLDEKDIQNNLDIACGTGRFLMYANFGVDISQKMVAVAKQKFHDKEINVSDAETLPFKDNTLNNALSFHLFMHLDKNQLSNILSETNRVLKKGGLFIFDIPSKKRRKITGYKSKDWHGGYQITRKELQTITNREWKLVAFYGISFFPIHRIPKKIRKYFISLDNLLCNSLFKEYASHLIFILEKK